MMPREEGQPLDARTGSNLSPDEVRKLREKEVRVAGELVKALAGEGKAQLKMIRAFYRWLRCKQQTASKGRQLNRVKAALPTKRRVRR